jgi:branched-chain amino acid transport system substrate-binding protein
MAQTLLKNRTRVGIILPLSGPVGFQGVAIKNAMLMARERFDTKQELELIFEDDVFQTKNALSAAQKLMTADKINVLVSFGAHQGLALAPRVGAAQLPMVAMTVLETVANDRPWLVTFLPSTEAMIARTAEEVARHGYPTMATVATQQDACLLQVKHLVDAAVTKIVRSDEIAPGDFDMRTVVTKIRAANPSAVFVSMTPPQGSILARQLRDAGYHGDIVTAIQTANLSELTAAKGALQGAWAVSGDVRAAEMFGKEYVDTFHEEPTSEAQYGYDLIPTLLAAAQSGDIKKFLRTPREFDGISGHYSLDADGVTHFPVMVKQFAADRFELAKFELAKE